MGAVVVVQHGARRREGLIGRKEHGALAAVAVIDDVEEHVGRIGPIGEVPDFVHDEHVGVRVREERVGEPTGAQGGGEIVNEFGRRHEARRD